MPTIQGGVRYARSFVTPTGAANEVARELDFQLATDGGIQILAVLGWGNLHDDSPPVSDTVPFNAIAHQSLHLESGETEDMPDVAGEDADDIDTEIFYYQHFVQQGIVGSTVTFGASATLTITPSGLWIPPKPVISARNIVHKGTTIGADQDLEAGLIIAYENIRFSRGELAVALARR